MSLNPDLLRVEFLGLTVRHDPVDMPRDDLALFFSAISERYGLSRLEYHSDGGATYSGNDGAEFVLRPVADRIVRGHQPRLSRGPGARGRASSRRPSSAMRSGSSGSRTSPSSRSGTSRTPSSCTSCSRAASCRSTPSASGCSGGDDVAVGLRIWRRSGDAAMECAVEPMHSEPSKVYIRLVQTQEDELAEASGLREICDAVYAFLLGPLTSFILARARR